MPAWYRSCLLIVSCICFALSGFLLYRDNAANYVTSKETNTVMVPTQFRSLGAALQHYAFNNLIVLASVDATYVPMALNLYLTSFKKWNIQNHLFVSSDEESCSILSSHGAHCVQTLNMTKANKPSTFGEPDYNIKTCIKPKMVLDCLLEGFDVLLVDLDIVFMKDPLPIVLAQCPHCDLVTQYDPRTKQMNSGFFLARHTPAGIKLFQTTVQLEQSNKSKNDQVYVNLALSSLKRKIKMEHLPVKLFPLGNAFFTQHHRMFVGDEACSQCVLVHNNYIVSLEAKVYRFKESGLWLVDTDGYYSDKRRKYIQYDNPVDFKRLRWKNTKQMEVMALKTALIIGSILNRTVIFPKFHCDGVKGYKPRPKEMCHFGMHYSIRKFESGLSGLATYRESVFLQHPLVPESTKKFVSDMFVIDGPVWQKAVRTNSDLPSEVSIVKPKGQYATTDEIREWFSKEESCVLTFHSLYNEIDCKNAEIKQRLDKAFVRSTHMQIR